MKISAGNTYICGKITGLHYNKDKNGVEYYVEYEDENGIIHYEIIEEDRIIIT